MTLLRPLSVFVAAACLFLSPMVKADAPPFIPSKQFSADQITVMKDGRTVNSKVYVDNGKMRSEMNMQGMSMVSIVRPDQQKIYSVMPAQKMVMVMPVDKKMTDLIAQAQGDDAKFDADGTETVEGVACTKYKMTLKDGKIFHWWVDASKKVPVKMAADDGSVSTTFKNYVIGAQDAALFEPPTDYQIMQMPSAPAPEGAGNGGAAPGGASAQ